jgi:hypothetical protein
MCLGIVNGENANIKETKIVFKLPFIYKSSKQLRGFYLRQWATYMEFIAGDKCRGLWHV